MNIVLAVDDSPFSRHMLAWLASRPEWLTPDQHYAVVHAQAPLPNGLQALLDESQVRVRQEDEAEAVFKPVRTFLEHHAIHADYLHPEGAADEAIVKEAARWKADLIIMGSHSHSTVAQWIMGSVVKRVLARCTVPVLVVPAARSA